MGDFFLSLPINEEKNICISPLTAEDLSECGIQWLGDDFGLFIYETFVDNPAGELDVLGKLASHEAAERLANLLEASQRHLRINRPAERYPQDPIADQLC